MLCLDTDSYLLMVKLGWAGASGEFISVSGGWGRVAVPAGLPSRVPRELPTINLDRSMYG